MATYVVTADQYRTIDVRMREIKRMLDQKEGSPLDPREVARHLQTIIEMQPVEPLIIDCSAQQMIPFGWKIRPKDQIASRFRDKFVWSPKNVRLHFDDVQKDSAIIGGDFMKKLKGLPVLPANVLDCLLENPELIPLDWMREDVGFWGTIYRDKEGRRCIRYLSVDTTYTRVVDGWLWDKMLVCDEFSPRSPAARLS